MRYIHICFLTTSQDRGKVHWCDQNGKGGSAESVWESPMPAHLLFSLSLVTECQLCSPVLLSSVSLPSSLCVCHSFVVSVQTSGPSLINHALNNVDCALKSELKTLSLCIVFKFPKDSAYPWPCLWAVEKGIILIEFYSFSNFVNIVPMGNTCLHGVIQPSQFCLISHDICPV